jgi:hypothetical protein
MRAIISALLLASATTGTAWAQEKAADPVAAGTTTAKTEKKVCRRMERTGSIMPSRSVCRSAREWAQFDNENRDAAEVAREARSRTAPPGQFD